jgi:hypothetical protein
MKTLKSMKLLPIYIVFFSLMFSAISCKKKEVEKDTVLKTQEQVENYVKIAVQPIINSKKNKVVFKLNLESYQNQKFLENDLTETTLLVDDLGNPFKALEWKVETKSEYKTTGDLCFDFDKQAKQIKLSFFDLKEIVFKWDL